MNFGWSANPWVWVLSFRVASGPLPEGKRERPILFKGDLVRAIIDGRKSQTRRPAKFVALEPGLNFGFSGLDAGLYHCARPDLGFVLRSRGAGGCWNDRTKPLVCPYGEIGDRLWVKETHGFISEHVDDEERQVMADARAQMPWAGVVFAADRAWTHDQPRRWRPSIHMPRWASRLSLEITAVRVERLHAITEEDAKAEGVEPVETTRKAYPSKLAADIVERSYREGFARKWREIHDGKARKAA